MSVYIGIDPGKSGGYAWITEDSSGIRTYVKPWDDENFMHDMRLVKECIYNQKVVACVEKVGAMPRQGVTSTFSFGKEAGFIEGVLSALGIPYQLITPRRWKTEFGLNSDKQNSISVCKKLFPHENLLPSPRHKKPNDGMAESLLMAEYAKRRL